MSLAAVLGSGFLAAVLVYLALTHFYSFVGKNVVILDAMLVAAGFVTRAVAGARFNNARIALPVRLRARSSSTCPSSTRTTIIAAASK